MTDADALKVLMALGDTGRFEIFRKLIDAPGLSGTELAAGRAASTISHHMKILENAGVVTERRVGRKNAYAVRPETMAEFSAWTTRTAELATYAALNDFLELK